MSKVVCPYHAWRYDLSIELMGAGIWKSPKVLIKNICRPEVRTEIWNGRTYVTLNPMAASVSDALSPLHDVVQRYRTEKYVPVLSGSHIGKTNWKLLTENFMEGYHLPIAHKATVGVWFLAEKTVFPTYIYVLAPDHLWFLSLRPKRVGKVDVRFSVTIAPGLDSILSGSDQRSAWIKSLIEFFDHVNSEDRKIVGSIYEGLRSSFVAPGPLSWLEREIHDFQKYLTRRLVPTHKNIV